MTTKTNIAKVYKQAGIKGMGEGTASAPIKKKIAKENMPNFGVAQNPRMEGESLQDWFARLKDGKRCATAKS